MPNLVRWILVPISGVLVFYLVLLLGILCLDFIGDFCPSDEVVSGLCTAWWYGRVSDGLILSSAFIVAVGVVLVPPAVAPGYRFGVAVLAYVCGATFALYAAVSGLWAECLASAIGGTLALGGAYKMWRDPLQGTRAGPTLHPRPPE